MDDKLEEDKQGLIELIEWYRDEYHKSDFCHTEMIEKIRNSPRRNLPTRTDLRE